jgi:hypothetical protein
VLQSIEGELIIFNAVGVFLAERRFYVAPLFRKRLPPTTWCLVDSNDTLQDVPAHIASLEALVIQTASPQHPRGRWISKSDFPKAYWIMQPPTLFEMLQGYDFLILHHCRL